jgi:branched-chain amino acid transport system substrate-binding protein
MTVVIDQPSSGLFAEQNRSITRGAQIAVDELNTGVGLTARHIRVKLLPEHLDGLSAEGLRSRLRSQAAAVLILPCDSESQSTLTGSAAQFGMLMLAPCNPDPTAGTRYPTYWPVGTPANEEAAGLAKFMSLYGYQSAFVISTPGNRYFELLTSYFRSAAQKRGIQLTGSGSLAGSSPDFSSLTRAVEASPRSSAIFAAVPPPLVNSLAAVLAARGVHRPIAGSAAMDTRRSLSRHTLENAFFPSNGFPRDSASARRFARDYTNRFHASPAGSFPGLGLETIRLLEDAVRKAGSAQPSSIQRALTGGLALSGVGLADRVYQNGGDHNPVGQVDISKISAGSLAPLVAITLP